MQNTRSLRRLVRRFVRNARGAAAVELGLIAPVLVGIVVPMVDLGLGAYQKMEVQDAAESGAQYALEHGWNQTSVQNAATNTTPLSGVTATAAESCHCVTSGAIGSAVTCGTTCADGSTAGTYVTVNTSATYTMLVNYPGLTNPMTLTGYSMIRIE